MQAEVKSSCESGSWVVIGKTFCSLRTKEQIQNGPLWNNSAAFIDCVGSSLKKDNINKHVGSEMHQRAIRFDSLYPCYPGEPQTAVVTRSLIGAGASKKWPVVKLFVISYVMAKLEIPLANFLSLPKWKSIVESTWAILYYWK